jgi:hypothetical protein
MLNGQGKINYSETRKTGKVFLRKSRGEFTCGETILDLI